MTKYTAARIGTSLYRTRWCLRSSRSLLLIMASMFLLAFHCIFQASNNGSDTDMAIVDESTLNRRTVLQRANTSESKLHVQQDSDNALVLPKPESFIQQKIQNVSAKPVLMWTVVPEENHEVQLENTADYDVEEFEGELERRRKRVQEVCQATGLNKQGHPNAWEFFIDHRHHLIWCNVFKAASSTWMYNFNLLAGYKEDYLKRSRKTPLLLARARFPRPSVAQLKETLPSYMSFMIVRDPFERLLSAYRNKIEGYRHKFYRKVAHDIVTKYRKPGGLNAGLKGPSFSEFIMHVVDTANKPDEHWAPYYQFCTPCNVNFTVIAQVETLSRDQEYVIHHAGISDILSLSRREKQKALNRAKGAPTAELLEHYFGQLSPELMQALYSIYKIDFDMFGYDADKYFKMIGQQKRRIK